MMEKVESTKHRYVATDKQVFSQLGKAKDIIDSLGDAESGARACLKIVSKAVSGLDSAA